MKLIEQKITIFIGELKAWWNNISKTDKIIIAILFFSIPLFFYFKLFFWPEINKIEKLKKEKITLLNKIENIKIKKIIFSKKRKEVQERERLLKKIQAILPTNKEIPELLTAISTEATKAGLKIISFQPEKEIKQEYYSQISIKIGVEGPFHQIVIFLDKIRKLQRIVNTKKVTFYRPQKRDNEWIVLANCQLETYRFLSAEEQKEQRENRGASTSTKKQYKKTILTEKEIAKIILQKDKYKYCPSKRPDPFKPFIFKGREQKKNISPLEKINISELKLVGIVETPKGKIAILEDNTGKGYFVTKDSKIGPNNGIITKITKNAIYIQEEMKNLSGPKTKREIVLKLKPAEE